MTDKKEKLSQLLEKILGFPINSNDTITRKTHPVWDSLKHIQILFALEEEFGTKLEVDDLSQIQSTDDILFFLEKKV